VREPALRLILTLVVAGLFYWPFFEFSALRGLAAVYAYLVGVWLGSLVVWGLVFTCGDGPREDGDV
jgi:predicted membrane protein